MTDDRTATGTALAPLPAEPREPAGAICVLAVLLVDAVLLAVLELCFLTLYWGSVPIPLSALLALVTTPWLVRSAGAVAGVPGASAVLGAWALVIFGIGLAGPGGDVLLPLDPLSMAQVMAGLLPGAFVLGRVIRDRRAAG